MAIIGVIKKAFSKQPHFFWRLKRRSTGPNTRSKEDIYAD